MKIEVDPDGVDWEGLHSLVRLAYGYMDDRIDPPSSLRNMTAEDFRRKAVDETLIAATSESGLVGCLFCRPAGGWLYVGKMAVLTELQQQGVGRLLIEQARALASEIGLQGLELETRIELTENHEAFAKLGFVKVADQSHAGYTRVTNIRMQAPLKS